MERWGHSGGQGRSLNRPPTATDSPTDPLQYTQFKQRQMTASNPYVAQILSQGKEPSKAPAPKATYPRTVGARVYQTEAEYQEALADWMNGN